jgi:hypothetical protein
VFKFPGYRRDANQNYTEISSHPPVRMARIKDKTTNAGANAMKQEPLYSAGGNANSTTTMESCMEIPQKAKDRTAIRSSDISPGPLPRYTRDPCTPRFIAALFTVAKLWKQPRCPATEERIKKIWYMYTQWIITQS